MDTIFSFVNIALAFSAYIGTRRIIQRHNTTAVNELHFSHFDIVSESDKTIKSCAICGTEEKDNKLLKAPCDQHFVCAADVASYFKHATKDESLFPPRCCNQIFMLPDYEQHVPAEIASAYLAKVQGEYTVLAKDRIYCANPPCARFLHPAQHIDDPQTNITYAICEADSCGKTTCVRCKMLLHDNTLCHACETNDDEDALFQRLVVEKGYQKCFECSAIIELTEACNHITCPCGASFCYICGQPWPGLHGCPVYGPARYNALGYNQDGFHRSTGLDADGLTRRQRRALEQRQQQQQRQHVYHQPQEQEQVQEDNQGQQEQQQQLVPASLMLPQVQTPSIPALPRIGLTLCILLLPRTSLVVRMGLALCVSLGPSLADWVPCGLGHEYDMYGGGWEDD